MADTRTIPVKALQPHTAFGQSYQPGDIYEIDEAFADTVVIQGKAARLSADEAKARATKRK